MLSPEVKEDAILVDPIYRRYRLPGRVGTMWYSQTLVNELSTDMKNLMAFPDSYGKGLVNHVEKVVFCLDGKEKETLDIKVLRPVGEKDEN